MNIELFESTKVASFFLWENTKHDNALELWYCAEDIACYLERNDILSMDNINLIKQCGKYDVSYVAFVRHIAFRIYVYTRVEDTLSNWFIAEKLLENGEWCQAISRMASIYSSQKNGEELVNNVRSDDVKLYYDSFSRKN